MIDDIGELTTNDGTRGGRLTDAAMVIEGDRIAWVGPSSGVPAADERVEVGGRSVLPGGVDAHTHLVFAGDRTAEFEARMAGQAVHLPSHESSTAVVIETSDYLEALGETRATVSMTARRDFEEDIEKLGRM